MMNVITKKNPSQVQGRYFFYPPSQKPMVLPVDECIWFRIYALRMSPFSEKVDRYPATLGLLVGSTALAVGLQLVQNLISTPQLYWARGVFY